MKPLKPGDRVVVYHGFRKIIGIIAEGASAPNRDEYDILKDGFAIAQRAGPFHRKQIRKLKPKIKSGAV